MFERRPEVLRPRDGGRWRLRAAARAAQQYPVLSLLFTVADATHRRWRTDGARHDVAFATSGRPHRRRRRSSPPGGGCHERRCLEIRRHATTAAVPEGVPITWRGRAFASGPLAIELSPREGPSHQGVLDYANHRARAEFHVRLSFPEFAQTLSDLGVDPALAEPVEAVLRSEGEILDDHGLSSPARATSGRMRSCRVRHARRRAAGTVTPGRGLPVGSPDSRGARERRVGVVAVHSGQKRFRSRCPRRSAGGATRCASPAATRSRRWRACPVGAAAVCARAIAWR